MSDDLRRRICLPVWDSLSKDEMEAAARQIERAVSGARFVRLEEHAQADQKRRVAVFEVNDVEMVLVPGGRRMLGFDPARLEESARAAWEGSFQEAGHPVQQLFGEHVGVPMHADMVQYLTDSLSPRREVLLEPFLLERRPAVAADEHFDDEDDERVEDDPHVAMAKWVAAGGFRLPTSAEWEHACSGGSDALFPWGDTWPADTDVSDRVSFKEHALPNAFGLSYGTSPYQPEIVDDPEELRHGDGGMLVCGASGPIVWTTFSPWYRYCLSMTDDRETWFEDVYVRRVRSIFPDR